VCVRTKTSIGPRAGRLRIGTVPCSVTLATAALPTLSAAGVSAQKASRDAAQAKCPRSAGIFLYVGLDWMRYPNQSGHKIDGMTLGFGYRF
jgi:hypothetical protein